jgi:hypothetical protein
LSTFFYGIGQVAIFNSVQNYYIDSFEKYAASAVAAGTLFRSIVGRVIPLITPELLDKVGVGWGISVFAFISVVLAPNPLLFYYYGGWLREICYRSVVRPKALSKPDKFWERIVAEF